MYSCSQPGSAVRRADSLEYMRWNAQPAARVRWKRSIFPLVCGRYGRVRFGVMPRAARSTCEAAGELHRPLAKPVAGKLMQRFVVAGGVLFGLVFGREDLE